MLGLCTLRWYVSVTARGVRHNSPYTNFLSVRVTKANPTQATDALITSADR